MKTNIDLRAATIRSAVLLSVALALAGCISSSSPSPPANTTVVVPNGTTTVVCSDGTPPPCRY